MEDYIPHYFSYIYDTGEVREENESESIGDYLISDEFKRSYSHIEDKRKRILTAFKTLFKKFPHLKNNFDGGYTVLDEDDWEDAYL